MSLDTSARPLAPPTVLEPTPVRLLLEEHRKARLDQIEALTVTDPTASDLDPDARRRALTAAKRVVEEIDEAVLRLETGSYGTCVTCAQRIVAERLLAVPYARCCVPCASRG